MVERFDMILLNDVQKKYTWDILIEKGHDPFTFYEECTNELHDKYNNLTCDYATIEWENEMEKILSENFNGVIMHP